jgi:hypothetical protein
MGLGGDEIPMNPWTSLIKNNLDTPERVIQYFNDAVTQSSLRDSSIEKSCVECIKDLFMMATINQNFELLKQVHALNETFCRVPLKKWELLKTEDALKFGFQYDWRISGVFYSIYPPAEIDKDTNAVLKDIYREVMGEKPVYSPLRQYRAVQICHQKTAEDLGKKAYKTAVWRSTFRLKAWHKNIYLLSLLTFSSDSTDDIRAKRNILLDRDNPEHERWIKKTSKKFRSEGQFIAPKSKLTSILLTDESDCKKEARKYYQLAFKKAEYLQCELLIDKTSTRAIDKHLKKITKADEKISWLRERIQSIYLITHDPELLRERTSYAKDKIREIIQNAKSPRGKQPANVNKALRSGSEKDLERILDDLHHRCVYLFSQISSLYMEDDELAKIKDAIFDININQSKLNQHIESANNRTLKAEELEEFTQSISIDEEFIKKTFPEFSNTGIDTQQYCELKTACENLMIEDLATLSDSVKKMTNPFRIFQTHVAKLNEKLEHLKESFKNTDVIPPRSSHNQIESSIIEEIQEKNFNDPGYNAKLARLIGLIKPADSPEKQPPSIELENLSALLNRQLKEQTSQSRLLSALNELNAKMRLLGKLSSSIDNLYWSEKKFSFLSVQYLQVQSYFINLIVTSPEGKEAKIIKNLISLSEMALKRKNFHIAHALFLALCDHDVARLPATESVINKNTSYKKLEALFSPENRQNYSRELNRSNKPPLPLITSIAGQIVQAKENSEKNRQEMLIELKTAFFRRQIALLASNPAMDKPLMLQDRKSDILIVHSKSDDMLLPPQDYEGPTPWHELSREEKRRFCSEKKSPRKSNFS